MSQDIVKEEKIVLIPKRSSTEEVAEILYNNSVINQKTPFLISSYINFANGRYIQPGEYKFTEGLNAHDALKKILIGDRLLRKIVVPEGYTVYQIKKVIKEAKGLIGEIFHYRSEGYLMPDTYHYFHGTTKESILAQMNNDIIDYLNKETPKYPENELLPGYHEILTLASIVEKEAVHDDERPIIASVYLNRLKRGMLLQADPTVIYGLFNGETDFDYTLTSKDLKHNSAYNTYIHKGLPPNPICNPGRKSIDAVLNPANTDYLYFVADGENGGHNFSTTYKKHVINVKNYRAKINN